jgi:hypothetical protein
MNGVTISITATRISACLQACEPGENTGSYGVLKNGGPENSAGFCVGWRSGSPLR